MRHVDVAVIGGGLAGTTLTWKLIDAGLDVVLIDEDKPSTCSRIAAGLMTPITGKRFAVTWEWNAFWQEANRFYRDVENRTKNSFFTPIGMVRLFQGDEERAVFKNREKQLGAWLATTSTEIDSYLIASPFGGFNMLGGKLDVSGYLNSSKRHFENKSCWICSAIDPDADVAIKEKYIELESMEIIAKQVVFCLGYSGINANLFPKVRFNPAKGEILTIESPSTLSQVIHYGIWIAPATGGTLQVGATYDWNDLSQDATSQARESLTGRLDEFFVGDYEVTRQDAAIRPTMHDFRPVVGFHPECPRFGILNGLGSKGSLMAPRLAQMLKDHLVSGSPIPHDVCIQRWLH